MGNVFLTCGFAMRGAYI